MVELTVLGSTSLLVRPLLNMFCQSFELCARIVSMRRTQIEATSTLTQCHWLVYHGNQHFWSHSHPSSAFPRNPPR